MGQASFIPFAWSGCRLGAILLTFGLAAGQPAMAQTELSIDYLAGGLIYDPGDDPEAALAAIEAALAELAAMPEPDPRVIFDLYRQQADILVAADRLEEAGAILRELAGYAAAHRDILASSPMALLSEAAELFERAGAVDAARGTLEALAEEQRGGGLSAEVIADTLRDIAALERGRGDDAAAAAFETRAKDTIAAAGDAARSGEPDHVNVKVFYATDRARTGKEDPARFFGYDRAEALDYGVATVTIPKIHRPGMIEKRSIWRGEFSLSPAKHVILKSVAPLSETAFFTTLDTEVQGTGDKEAFVFIHGYNVTFESAAKRAAQMAYDMNFAGLPVLYSWPSRGSAMGYIRDTAVVRLSGRRLSLFLEDLAERTGAEKIHIVAHSMGNRAVTDALELMALRRGVAEGDPPVFGQVVFAAPDVDAGLFRAMMPTIRPLAERLTLYASEQDWALYASRKIHGDAPRAGQAGAEVLVSDDFDSVDMSLLGTDMLAHSYFSSALLDLYSLFWRNLPPQQRCGIEPREAERGTAWRYLPDACDDETLLNVLFRISQDDSLMPQDVERMLLPLVGDAEVARSLANTVIRMFPE